MIAHILFDTSASCSFVSTRYVGLYELSTELLVEPIYVATLVGRSLMTGQVCKSCNLKIGSFEFTVDLIVLSMVNFDVCKPYHGELLTEVDCIKSTKKRASIFFLEETKGSTRSNNIIHRSLETLDERMEMLSCLCHKHSKGIYYIGRDSYHKGFFGAISRRTD